MEADLQPGKARRLRHGVPSRRRSHHQAGRPQHPLEMSRRHRLVYRQRKAEIVGCYDEGFHDERIVTALNALICCRTVIIAPGESAGTIQDIAGAAPDDGPANQRRRPKKKPRHIPHREEPQGPQSFHIPETPQQRGRGTHPDQEGGAQHRQPQPVGET